MSKMELEPADNEPVAAKGGVDKSALAAAASAASQNNGAAGATWAQLAKGVKQPASGSQTDDAGKQVSGSAEPVKLANGIGKHDDADSPASAGSDDASEASAAGASALPTPAPTPSTSPTPLVAVPAPPPAVNIWKVRMQQQGPTPSSAPISGSSASPKAGGKKQEVEAVEGEQQWPDLADATVALPSSNEPNLGSAQGSGAKLANGQSAKDAAMKKKQWMPLEVDIKYKDPPTKPSKKPVSAVPSHTRQRSENSPAAESAETDSPKETVTEHHQVGGHEVTIKKIVFPGEVAPGGKGVSVHGRIGGGDEGSAGSNRGDDKAGSDAASSEGQGEQASNVGYFRSGAPAYRGNAFPPQPPNNNVNRGRTFAQNQSQNPAQNQRTGNGYQGNGTGYQPGSNRRNNFQQGQQTTGQQNADGKPQAGMLQPPQQGNRRAASLPPRPSPPGSSNANAAALSAGTNQPKQTGSGGLSNNQSMTPGRRTSGNPGGYQARNYYGGAAGSAPSSPQGQGGNQYYGGGYNPYMYNTGSYNYGGYGYSGYGQPSAEGGAGQYLADPTWYPSGTLATPWILAALRAQIEWYFSVENMIKDLYLRRNMDAEGFIDGKIIAGFRRILGWMDHLMVAENHLNTPVDDPWFIDRLVESVQGSEVVEILSRDGSSSPRFRKRGDWTMWVLPQQSLSNEQQEQRTAATSPTSPTSPTSQQEQAEESTSPKEASVATTTLAPEPALSPAMERPASALSVASVEPVVVNVEEAEAQVLVEEVSFVTHEQVQEEVKEDDSAKVVEQLAQSASLENGDGFVDHDGTDSDRHKSEHAAPKEVAKNIEAPAKIVEDAAPAAELPSSPTKSQKGKSSWAAAVGGKTATEQPLLELTKGAAWADDVEHIRPAAIASESTSEPVSTPSAASVDTVESAGEAEVGEDGWTTVNTKKPKKAEKPAGPFRSKRGGGGGKRGGSRSASGTNAAEPHVSQDEDDRADWRKRANSRTKQAKKAPQTATPDTGASVAEPAVVAQES